MFYGYFESPKYFDEIREVLLEDFKPVFKPKAANAEIYTAALSENSICVSIRRGDFVGDRIHDVCKKDYFDRAIFDAICHVRQARLIFFSDDIDWVHENFQFPEGMHPLYESGEDEVFEKIHMMRSCKNFVISNSTFSWWAQYLSTNPDKVVVAPSRWLNVPLDGDIYQPNWRLVSV